MGRTRIKIQYQTQTQLKRDKAKQTEEINKEKDLYRMTRKK